MGIESTYFHVMNISRIGDKEETDGSTVQDYVKVPLLQLLPCGYSQSKRNVMNAEQTDSVNKIVLVPKIFCDPALDVRVGDRLEVHFKIKTAAGFTLKKIGDFQASEPLLYDSHQEIPLLGEGEA